MQQCKREILGVACKAVKEVTLAELRGWEAAAKIRRKIVGARRAALKRARAHSRLQTPPGR
jgi:hypothetical protein